MRNLLVISAKKLTQDEELFLTNQFLENEQLFEEEDQKNIENYPKFIYLSTVNLSLSNKIADEWISYEEKQEIVEEILNICETHDIYVIYSTVDYMLTELLSEKFNTVASFDVFSFIIESLN
jgi:hypothetical protein